MPWGNEANLACGAQMCHLSFFICLFHPISLYAFKCVNNIEALDMYQSHGLVRIAW